MGPGREFDRIREMVRAFGDAAGPIGGDTAPVPAGTGTLVVSTDASVEGVHFRRDWLSDGEIGWRATAAALSDLAASAALPAGITVSIAVPDLDDIPLLTGLATGIGEAAAAAGCRVLGGDLVRGPAVMIDITAFGYVTDTVTRSGAVVGDGIWVTGVLGGSRAALVSWLDGRNPVPAARMAFARPRPRIRAGRWLAASGATAMMDLSDGIGGDARHLAAASGCGLEIDLDRLPVHPSALVEGAHSGVSPKLFAAAGGEDYELLVTLPAGWDSAADCEPATGVGITRIGRVVDGEGVRFLLEGLEVEVGGFDHGRDGPSSR